MKYKILAAAASLVLVLSIAGCKEKSPIEEGGSDMKVIKISAQEAKTMMDEEEVIVVDVRTEEEFKEAHIEGAIRLTLDTIEEKAKEVLPAKEAKYLVYCRSGNRSATASELLKTMGYENIYDFGGIVDWPYETVTGDD